MLTPPFNVSNISTGMSLIIFFRKSTDITLRIAALSPMLENLRKGTAERREREMKFGCKFCQTTIVTLVIQGLPSSFLYRNPSCVSSLSLFEGRGGCTQCDTVERFRSLPHLSEYIFYFFPPFSPKYESTLSVVESFSPVQTKMLKRYGNR